MIQLLYLEKKKLSNLDRKINSFYNYNISKENIQSCKNLSLYNSLINIHNNRNIKLDKLNKNLTNFNNYTYIDILKNINTNNIDTLLYSILYCIDSNISFLDINLFLKEFKLYILYNISNIEFDNKNKVIKNLEHEEYINHLTLVFLSNYLSINIYIIRINNLYKIESNKENKNIILIKNNNKYYGVYNNNDNSFYNKIVDIEDKFKKYNNYDFDYLKAISYYKVDELRDICKLFNININKENNKKKTKNELYNELICNI